jgi:hypothetical protein
MEHNKYVQYGLAVAVLGIFALTLRVNEAITTYPNIQST